MKVRGKDLLCRMLALMMVAVLVFCVMPMNAISAKADTNTIDVVADGTDNTDGIDSIDNAIDTYDGSNIGADELIITGKILLPSGDGTGVGQGYKAAEVCLVFSDGTEAYGVTTDESGKYEIVITEGLNEDTEYRIKVTPKDGDKDVYEVYIDGEPRKVSSEDVDNQTISIEDITLTAIPRYNISTKIMYGENEDDKVGSILITDGNDTTEKDDQNIEKGTSRTITVTPNIGYKVKTVTINGSPIVDGCVNDETGVFSYKIDSVSDNLEIVAILEEKTITISCTIDENGKISLNSDVATGAIEITTSGDKDVAYTTEAYKVTASVTNDDYHIISFVVDNKEQIESNKGTNDCKRKEYIFEEGITESHTIDVKTAIDQYSLTINKFGSGTVKVDDVEVAENVSVNAGSTPTITITPTLGNCIAAVKINGTEIVYENGKCNENAESYLFELPEIDADMIVSIEFENSPLELVDVPFDQDDILVQNSGIVESTDVVKYYSNQDIYLNTLEGRLISYIGRKYCNSLVIKEDVRIESIFIKENNCLGFLKEKQYKLNKPVCFIIDKEKPIIQSAQVLGAVETSASTQDEKKFVVSKEEEDDVISIQGYITDENLSKIIWSTTKYEQVQDVLSQTTNSVNSFATEDNKHHYKISDLQLSEDVNTFYLYAIDKANNVSDVQKVMVLRDGTAPSVNVAIVDGTFNELKDNLFTNEDVRITLKVQDSTDANGNPVQASGVKLVKITYEYKVGETGETKTVSKEFSGNEILVDNQDFVVNMSIPVIQDETIYLSTLTATITDYVGNQSENTIDTMTCQNITGTSLAGDKVILDGVTPKIITVSSEADYVEVIGDGSNKNWYKEIPNINVSASDQQKNVNGSGLASRKVFWAAGNLLGVDVVDRNEEIISFYTKDSNAFNSGEKVVQEEAFEITAENLKRNENFTGIKEGANTIRVEYIDNAGNKGQDEEVLYLDTSAPTITHFEISEVESNPIQEIIKLVFGNYYNSKVQITVSANDNECTNAGAYDIADVSGVKEISLLLDGKVVETKEVDGNGKATFEVPYSEIIGEDLYLDAYITATAVDYVGNISEEIDMTTGNSNMEDGIENSNLMIETVKPIIGIETETYGYVNADGIIYSNEDTTFEITAKDDDSGLRNVIVNIYRTDESGELQKNTVLQKEYYNGTVNSPEQGEEKRVAVKEDVYQINTNMVDESIDGIYRLEVIIVDLAGNQSAEIRTIYKDEDIPIIKGYSFEGVGNIEGDGEELSVEEKEYGFYFREETAVTISATDVTNADKQISASGVKAIEYYMVNEDGSRSAAEIVSVGEKNQITFILQPGFKGQIYARAIDQLGNKPKDDGFVNPNSVIVESVTMHESEEHIIMEAPKTAYVDGKENPLYANDTTIKVTVADTYSGIREIEWFVVAPQDTDKNQSGKLQIDNSGNYTEASNAEGWSKKAIDNNLITALEKDITVTNNSNEIQVYVKMTDRAGNVSEEKIMISIDKTIPVIEVTFDNETPDTEFTDFYKENRTATVTIKERNFKAENIKCEITNVDGTVPNVSAWQTNVNTDIPDSTTNVATIVFEEDGDYVLVISGKDAVDNEAIATEEYKFTIDKTMPEILVTYNNENATNGNYYDAERTATIQIKEHNFEESRVNIIGTAIDGETTITFPTTSSWMKGDDIYTATIQCSQDAFYQFDVEYMDKAGNKAETYVGEEFYVDKTMPEVEIRGVEDMSANNGVVTPSVIMSDSNYDANGIRIELTGANHGTITPNGSYISQTNGQIFSFADFEYVQDSDDIYTLAVTTTDMAGNETTDSVVFSVNRFGSVYVFDESLKDIRGTYVQQEMDIKLTEVNVDSLEHDSIKVVVDANGTPRDLVEGTDYVVKETGGNGSWHQYDYTIDKSLFEGDGRYIVTLYSEDVAGNVNANIDETKEAEISFGIDKTAPVVIPIDIESNEQYAVDTKNATVTVNDNLVLENVEICVGEKSCEYVQENDSYTFEIPSESSSQNVTILATDAAGNRTEYKVENILVTTNAFVRWYNNKPMMVATIGGIATVSGGGAGISTALRRRKIRVRQK